MGGGARPHLIVQCSNAYRTLTNVLAKARVDNPSMFSIGTVARSEIRGYIDERASMKKCKMDLFCRSSLASILEFATIGLQSVNSVWSRVLSWISSDPTTFSQRRIESLQLDIFVRSRRSCLNIRD
jgi:hypothetical protein